MTQIDQGCLAKEIAFGRMVATQLSPQGPLYLATLATTRVRSPLVAPHQQICCARRRECLCVS